MQHVAIVINTQNTNIQLCLIKVTLQSVYNY